MTLEMMRAAQPPQAHLLSTSVHERAPGAQRMTALAAYLTVACFDRSGITAGSLNRQKTGRCQAVVFSFNGHQAGGRGRE
jgi:hypothetical protein